MNNYIIKKSNNWEKKQAGVINSDLEWQNVNEKDTHYIGVAISGFTWSYGYARQLLGDDTSSYDLANVLFKQVADKDEVGTLFPGKQMSFMPVSVESENVAKYAVDAFNLHEMHIKTKNIWLDLRFLDNSVKEQYMNRFIEAFSKSQYVECIFVAADERFE